MAMGAAHPLSSIGDCVVMDREGVKGRENAPLTLALSRERLCHNQLSSLRATEGRAAISILSGTSEIASVASLLLMNNFEGHCERSEAISIISVDCRVGLTPSSQ